MVFSDKTIEIVKDTNGGNDNKESFAGILYACKKNMIIDVKKLSLQETFHWYCHFFNFNNI